MQNKSLTFVVDSLRAQGRALEALNVSANDDCTITFETTYAQNGDSVDLSGKSVTLILRKKPVGAEVLAEIGADLDSNGKGSFLIPQNIWQGVGSYSYAVLAKDNSACIVLVTPTLLEVS